MKVSAFVLTGLIACLGCLLVVPILVLLLRFVIAVVGRLHTASCSVD